MAGIAGQSIILISYQQKAQSSDVKDVRPSFGYLISGIGHVTWEGHCLTTHLQVGEELCCRNQNVTDWKWQNVSKMTRANQLFFCQNLSNQKLDNLSIERTYWSQYEQSALAFALRNTQFLSGTDLASTIKMCGHKAAVLCRFSARNCYCRESTTTWGQPLWPQCCHRPWNWKVLNSSGNFMSKPVAKYLAQLTANKHFTLYFSFSFEKVRWGLLYILKLSTCFRQLKISGALSVCITKLMGDVGSVTLSGRTLLWVIFHGIITNDGHIHRCQKLTFLSILWLCVIKISEKGWVFQMAVLCCSFRPHILSGLLFAWNFDFFATIWWNDCISLSWTSNGCVEWIKIPSVCLPWDKILSCAGAHHIWAST